MFEQELEMENKKSSIAPLLLMVALIVVVAGVALYYVREARRVLTTSEAAPLILASLDSQGPPAVRFQTGVLKATSNQYPTEPHYRLLEKAGYLKIGKEVKGKTPVSITPQGEAFLAGLTGVKKSQKSDGIDEYVVPLAQRRLVEIGKITMVTSSKAAVEYVWKWEPNQGGDLFDAAGPAVKAFSTWDRAKLIEKHGANFYHEAPSKVVIAVMKVEKGWKIATQ